MTIHLAQMLSVLLMELQEAATRNGEMTETLRALGCADVCGCVKKGGVEEKHGTLEAILSFMARFLSKRGTYRVLFFGRRDSVAKNVADARLQ